MIQLSNGSPAPELGSGAMFDRIASRYDRLNRILSLGMDRRWRRALVDVLGQDAKQVLDAATGTADVAIAAALRLPEAHVIGVDPSPGMLEAGRAKVRASGLESRLTLEVGDVQALRFGTGRFDAACISFGIRNVADRLAGLSELRRVVRVGGVVAVLELGEPDGVFGPFARAYVHHVVPRLGAWLSRAPEYQYLQRSIAAFPSPAEFLALMREAGITDLQHRRFNFGGTNLFFGTVRS